MTVTGHAPCQRPGGFTLVELLVCVVILGVLAMVSVPMLEVTIRRNKEEQLRLSLMEIRSALDRYHRASMEGRIQRSIGDSGYPPDLATLVQGVADLQSPDRRRMYFLRRVPRDPMTSDASVPAHQTWGLRSYESPPDDPRPGADVFDVYSLSEGSGLNGIPYREW